MRTASRYSRSVCSCVLLLGVSLLVPPMVGTTSGQPNDRLSEGLKVLRKFTGTWTTHTQIRHEGPPPREFSTRGTATCRQTLGNFFEFRTRSIPPGDADLQIMTFDPATNLYHQWVFDADGYHHEADGKWDPSTSILRWTGKVGDQSFVVNDHWVSPNRLEWTLVRTDSNGKQVQSIKGTVVRTGK